MRAVRSGIKGLSLSTERMPL
uniref:Uncharacterized protein n=1 Tax=Arundo donax TaxID=35708 RepID=A0A0A9ASU8_ARUDO